MHRKRLVAAGAGAAAVLLTAACGAVSIEAGGDFPEKAITLFVVNPPGSAPDINARALAQSLEPELGQPVVIKNVPGGTGMVGLSELAAEEPDGYSIAFAASNNLTAQPQLVETAFTGPEMIEPIAQVTEVPAVVFVNARSDITTIEEFVAAAKARPGQLKLGIPTQTSIQNIQLEVFARQAGITFDKLATGAGQQVLPVVNGTLEAGVVQPGPILQYVERGDLRIIGVLGARVPEQLDGPSFASAGYGSDYVGYEGLVAPAGTPPDVVQRLQDAVQKATESPEFATFIRDTYGIAAFAPAAEYGARLEEDVARSARYIAEFDLKADG